MENKNVRCSFKHRLFDVREGSKLIIQMKCANKHKCKDKKQCLRKTQIVIGTTNEVISEAEMHPNHCPICNSLVFYSSERSKGAVKIKCQNCTSVVNLTIDNSKPLLIVA